MKVIVNENPSDISNFGQVARLSHHKQGGGVAGNSIRKTYTDDLQKSLKTRF